MKIHNMSQGTPEWFEVRKGKMTASNAQAIATAGKGLQTYIWKILADKIAHTTEEGFSNIHTERGKELESVARGVYELETGVTVEEVGFIEYDEYIGCSPDGLVGDDGGIEIKCHNNVGHFTLMVEGERAIDTGYIWQIQMNLMITRRKYWDYISYNPNFEKSILIFRIYPDSSAFEKLEQGFIQGKKLIDEISVKL